MDELYIRAASIEAAGFAHESGDALIVADMGGGEVLNFAFPSDDIPQLMLLLSRAYAQSVSGTDAKGSLGIVTPADSAQAHLSPDGESIALFVQLSAGTPVSLGLPLSAARLLRDELNETLGI